MTNQIGVFNKKLTDSKNLRIGIFLILMFLAACNSNSTIKEEKASNYRIEQKETFNSMPENQNAIIELDRVYQNAEIMPEFVSGIEKFKEFLDKNLVYPVWEKRQKIEGRVFITFVIERDGSTTNFEIVRMPSGSINLGHEAVRVMRLMPKWTPAEIEGEKVRMRYTLPIEFKLP